MTMYRENKNASQRTLEIKQARYQYLTAPEAAAFIGVSDEGLLGFEKAGSLAPDLITAGGHRRYTEDTLTMFLHNSIIRNVEDNIERQKEILEKLKEKHMETKGNVVGDVDNLLKTHFPDLHRVYGFAERIVKVIEGYKPHNKAGHFMYQGNEYPVPGQPDSYFVTCGSEIYGVKQPTENNG